MRSVPLVVGVPWTLLMMCSVAWIVAETLRRMHARGTRGRYVWASVERPTRYPAIAYLVISAILNARVYDDWLMFCLNSAGVALQIGVLMEKKHNGDDDDYWHTFKDRVSAFLGRRTPVGATGM